MSGTILRAEGTAPSEWTAPTLPAATFYESLATSGEMPVTVQALRNTALNMGMVITRLGANAVRNVSDEEITNGSTGNNPATVGHPFPITKQVKTGATTTAGVVSGKWVVTSGDVEEWINALDDRYLTVANAHNSGGRPHVGMMFSKLGRDSVRWIKNTASGDYYWQDNWRVGMPSTFMGYPIVMTDHLPAADKVHGLYGNFGMYMRRSESQAIQGMSSVGDDVYVVFSQDSRTLAAGVEASYFAFGFMDGRMVSKGADSSSLRQAEGVVAINSA